jgi:hypothetical protein
LDRPLLHCGLKAAEQELQQQVQVQVFVVVAAKPKDSKSAHEDLHFQLHTQQEQREATSQIHHLLLVVLLGMVGVGPVGQ